MKIINYFKIVFSNIISNIHFLGKYRLNEGILTLCPSIEQIKKNLVEIYFAANKKSAEEYACELEYLRPRKTLDMIPYKQIKKIQHDIHTDFDHQNNLPFVVHNNKRLYFPRNWDLKKVESQYRYFIERENLLGGEYTTKAPHQYQTDSFKIESGDILLDVGSAEGLIALDAIEKAKKVILYESDPIWEPPLKATFEPYKNKVQIINKLVGDNDNATSTTLQKTTQELKNETFFVKMDIEGAEELVVKGNANFFKNNKIKIACCTYHKANHYEKLRELFENWGYSVTSSNGYMLCFIDDVFTPPFFRKGLIRATNIK